MPSAAPIPPFFLLPPCVPRQDVGCPVEGVEAGHGEPLKRARVDHGVEAADGTYPVGGGVRLGRAPRSFANSATESVLFCRYLDPGPNPLNPNPSTVNPIRI